MQIQKVQSKQQNFGTKVHMDAYTARMLSVSRAKNQILKDISLLENNGINDILSLSIAHKDVFHLCASVFDSTNVKLSFLYSEPLITFQKNGKNKYANIKNLYKKAKQNLNDIVINKNGFEKFLPYIV